MLKPHQLRPDRRPSLFRKLVGPVICLLSVTPALICQTAVPILTGEARGIVGLTQKELGKESKSSISESLVALLVATDNGLYLIDEASGQIEEIPDAPAGIQTIRKAGQRVLISNVQGIYALSLKDRKPKSILPKAQLLDVVATGSFLWLSTDLGVYRLSEADSTIPIKLTTQAIGLATESNQAILIATKDGLYRVNASDTAAQPLSSTTNIQCVKNIGGSIWIGTKEGLYYLDSASTIHQVIIEWDLPQPTDVKFIAETNGFMWFVASDRIYFAMVQPQGKVVIVGSQPIDHGDIRGAYYLRQVVQTMKFRSATSGEIAPTQLPGSTETWIATSEGLFFYSDPNRPRRIPDASLTVKDMLVVNEHVWVATVSNSSRGDKVHSGLLRVDKDVSIKLDVQSEDSWWQSIADTLLPNLRVNGPVSLKASYAKGDQSAEHLYGSERPKFKTIMKMDESSFNSAVKDEEQYSLLENTHELLRPGTRTIFLRVKDQWGNTFDERKGVLVIPGPFAMSALLAGFWILSLLTMVGLAPSNSFCLGLLMNRYIRKVGYFNLTPIIITAIPPIRLHVLRKYRDSLLHDQNLVRLQQQFVVPSDKFTLNQSLEALRSHKKILLLGQSGIGKTAYFKYLVISYLSRTGKTVPLRRLIPILLPLGRYRGTDPIEMVHIQLANYGQLTDQEITEDFLKQGGFIIFLDGLNEIDSPTRARLNAFIERYWIRNYFFLSSQEDYTEFAAERVRLSTLGRDQIHELLSRHLPIERADAIARTLDHSMYDIYKVPHELGMALDLLADDLEAELPRTRKELYDRKFKPVFRKWEDEGHTEFPERLMEIAYHLLTLGSFDFQLSKVTLPSEIRNDLMAANLLIARGENYNFSHDQVGAFLASQYFFRRWRDLLVKGNLNVGFNWEPMLKFAISYIEDSLELRDLLLFLIKKDKFLAIDLFKWQNGARPGLTESWSTVFERSLGAAMLY